MASTIKDFTDSASKFVNTSLDNVKNFIDRTSDEVVQADMIAANRRIADQVIDATKETVNRVADSAAKSDPVETVLSLATGTLDGARETVRVVTEEAQRINIVETGSRVTQEGLDLVRRQVELSFEASRELGQVANRVMPFRLNPVRETARPAGVVTRVEIESDTGTIKTEPAAGAR